ncbi:prepilin-type N-terminal cleavage/methylation domain-containing protein [Opitutaceae bacterium TAV4]|nr:prepilin-type N-terminal cleavage/methylation domain-containing protein [Opitutaceae bacterium TAV4]RRK02458.1 prepilin-type N-terminal cleavage/methylation domain-containing protein [Opitutaceae bacterium TAV3]
MKKRYNSRSTQSAAFTLIELLTVVAIIGILAGIILGTIGNVRKKAHQVRCISNLRQVGIAMLAYVSDNKEKLPGPIYYQVQAKYGWKQYTELAARLATYAGYPNPETLGANVRPYFPLLHCPSRGIQDTTTDSIATFAAQCDLDDNKSGNNNRHAFGVPDEGNKNVFDPPGGTRPLRYSELEAVGGISRTWALIEVDQTITYGVVKGRTGWYNSLPKTPPHGNKRTVLWFDGRVNLLAEQPARY